MLPIQTILHPTDFSDRSDYAFRLACSLARDHGAHLIVLHVAEPPLPLYAEGAMIPPVSEDPVKLGQKKLGMIRAPDAKVAIDHRLTEGEAAPEIVRVARETKADLIVMGTHGRTGLGRLLVGSVAEEVLRKAPCPVLTTRMPFQDPATREEPVPVTLARAKAGRR
jgi:nucleotide-binding universal stress UspA family protein